jgi:hypothetical protein
VTLLHYRGQYLETISLWRILFIFFEPISAIYFLRYVAKIPDIPSWIDSSLTASRSGRGYLRILFTSIRTGFTRGVLSHLAETSFIPIFALSKLRPMIIHPHRTPLAIVFPLTSGQIFFSSGKLLSSSLL